MGLYPRRPLDVSAKSVETSGRFVKAGEDKGYRTDKQATTESITDAGKAVGGDGEKDRVTTCR